MKEGKSESKKLALLYLQELFLLKTDSTHYIRMPEILDYLAERDVFVDRRTIYTDISILNQSGFEIEGVQEKGGYKYHHINRKFDTNELKVLIDSVAASKFLTLAKSRELIAKIKSLGIAADSNSLNRNVLLGKRIKSMNDKVLKNLDMIHAAINNNEQLSFLYMKWNPKKELEYVRKGETYIVSPFAVTLDDDNYYMIAYDKKFKNIRHYRIDKMQSIKYLHEDREGMESFKFFDIADYTQKTFGMFSGKEESIRIKCKNSLAGVFIDRFGKDVSIRPDLDDNRFFIARITVNVSPQFYAWLFGLGKDITILSPDNVIEEYQGMLKETLQKYND